MKMRKSEARSEIIRLLHYGRRNLSLSAQQQDALEIAIDWLELKTDFRDTYQGIKPEDKLVKCGCGGQPSIIEGDYEIDAFMVRCEKCFMDTPWHTSKIGAVKIWNTAMKGNKNEQTNRN
jgi:hypothetical protein